MAEKVEQVQSRDVPLPAAKRPKYFDAEHFLQKYRHKLTEKVAAKEIALKLKNEGLISEKIQFNIENTYPQRAAHILFSDLVETGTPDKIHRVCSVMASEEGYHAMNDLGKAILEDEDLLLPTKPAQTSFSSAQETAKALCDDPHVCKLKTHVTNRYKKLKPTEGGFKIDYVRLALLEARPDIPNEGESSRRDFLENLRNCGSKGGKVDRYIDIEDLLKPASDQSSEMKVVYGQAGVGKTTMLTHICRSLAWDKVKTSYNLVLYFPLREVVSSVNNFSDLLSYYASDDPSLDLCAVQQALVNSSYKEVLFLFDGADEVQDLFSSKEKGILRGLLEGRVVPQADVIVSSRPGGLPQLMRQNVSTFYEIHGFDQSSIKMYIDEFFKSRPEEGERLWKELKSRDDLMGGAHIPMNLFIFCTILGHAPLPPTMTDCCKQYIVQVYNRESADEEWTDFDESPKDVEQLLLCLGSLAYNGMMSTPSMFVFQEKEVKKAFGTSSLDKSVFKGLLQVHPSAVTAAYSHKNTFNFSHATQQELFSAYYIKKHLSVEEQIDFLRGNTCKPKFSMVLRFYAGLTRLADEHVVRAVLYEPTFFDSPFLRNDSTADSIISTDRLQCTNEDPGLLHLFHFLYESQNFELAQSVAKYLDGKSISFLLFLTSYDTRVIAHCLTKSNNFKNLYFGEYHTCTPISESEHIWFCVRSILMSGSMTRIDSLSFMMPLLTLTNASHLNEGLTKTAVEQMTLNVEHVDLSALPAFFEAPGLKKVELKVSGDVRGCSDSNQETAESVAKNTRIKKLEITSPPSLLLPVVKGLATNTCVEELHLHCTGEGGDEGSVGQALAAACTANTTLKSIWLSGVSPFPLMEVLGSRKVPLESLTVGGTLQYIDSNEKMAELAVRNARIKTLCIISPPSFLLPAMKGLATNTCVEELHLTCRGDDEGGVGQALAAACTANTTMKSIWLAGVSPFPLMEVLGSRKVPLERLTVESGDVRGCSDSNQETAESVAKNTRIKKLQITSPPSLLLPVVKGLATNTCVEELDLHCEGDDEGGVGQALAAACTANTTLKSIWLTVVSPFPLMEVLGSRKVPLESLTVGGTLQYIDSNEEMAELAVRNARIKKLNLGIWPGSPSRLLPAVIGLATLSSPSLLLPVVKGLATNTCVEELDLTCLDGDDEGGVGQALAAACTANTTLKSIRLTGVSPFPLMEVLGSRKVPLERLIVQTFRMSADVFPDPLKRILHSEEGRTICNELERLGQKIKVERLEVMYLHMTTEHWKAFADGLSRNKFLKHVNLCLPKSTPVDVIMKDYIS